MIQVVAGHLPGYTHFVPVKCCQSVPTTELEQKLVDVGRRFIAGLDEVGRGSWAGPVVAAAVMLPLGEAGALARLADVRDSKQLPAAKREQLSEVIADVAVSIGIGWASHHVIDRLGIAAANRWAMVRAIRHLSIPPDALLVDYFRLPECDIPQVCVPKGDSISLSIAAASIMAKTMRDRWMKGCACRFPGYDFGAHKGYGTTAHREAILQLGFSPLHRRSFRMLPDEEG